jgi:SNF2 family DNA or RNA helicase
MKIIDEIRERNEKAVIFSQWMKMLDLIHDRLLEKGIEFAVIKGENNVNQRQKAIKRFK